MAKTRTHYDNLKVARNAPASVIKAAYKALCQTYHPDKFQGNQEEAEKIMKIINASYAVLIDPVKREAHDTWIDEQDAKAKQQSEKAQFGTTSEATEQQYYQAQDKHDIPKTEEPYSSTNSNTSNKTASEQWNYQKQDAQWKYSPPPLSQESNHKSNPPPDSSLWNRFWARNIDFGLFTIALIIFGDLGIDLTFSQNKLIIWSMWFIGSDVLLVLYEAAWLSTIGTTPGKALFSIRVLTNSGEKLSFSQATKRSFLVLASGCAFLFFFPVMPMIAMWRSYKQIKNTGIASWDNDNEWILEHNPIGIFRLSTGVFIGSVSMLALSTILIINKELSKKQIQAQLTQSSVEQFEQPQSQDQTQPAQVEQSIQERTPSNDNSAEYMNHHADDLYNQGRYAEALPFYQYLAEQGDASAQINLGVMYIKGQGVAPNDNQAVYWFNKAAEQGNQYAQYNLGVMYSEGRGVIQDSDRAAYWYRKAAEQGDTEAINKLRLLSLSSNKQELTQASVNKYSGERISLNFEEIDIRSIVAMIAEFTGMKIIASNNVVGTVNLKVDDMPWDQALDMAIESKGFVSRRIGNTIYIVTPTEASQLEENQSNSSQNFRSVRETADTYYVELENGKSIELKGNIHNLKKEMSESRLSPGYKYDSNHNSAEAKPECQFKAVMTDEEIKNCQN